MMIAMSEDDFLQMPGLYRLWDLQFVLNRTDEFQVHYVEQTSDGIPLFAVYCRGAGTTPRSQVAS